ncbi:MAG TPA: FecR domain-containing protein [Puia sp.]|nr:FecR domain-containing protein [Puia sp.]
MEPSYDIDPIVLKYVRERSLSADEAARLRQWLAGSNDRREIIDRMRDDPDWVLEQLRRMQDIRTEAIWSKVESRITPQHPSIPLPARTGRRWWLYTAAASIIVLCAGGWFWYSHQHQPTPASAAPVAVATDVKPGGNRAILTLADGRRIDLGVTANGVLASQGNTKVAKLADGQLAYNKEKTTESQPTPTIAYNILSTPRAGQYTLHLPDGTRVWLNNASVLKYPVAFTGADRAVELTGEAYFEVARDAAHPFRVKVENGPTVDVLGTSFNVMAYPDEPTERTTLIDGSIRVTQNNQHIELNPAQQSSLDAQGKLRVTSDVNVQEVIAWKNGYFHFDNSSLQTTMRQLARWYDVDVEYQGQLPEHVFSGKIQRNLSLLDILKNLESDQVHFKLEGRKLLVTP